MSDLPPDLPRLRALETYLRLQLAAVREAIARAEAERRRDPPEWVSDPNANYNLPGRRPAPTDPNARWWRMQPTVGPPGTGLRPAYVHRADCLGSGRFPAISRSEAELALRDQTGGHPTAQPCPRCRPDLDLGET